MEYNLPDPVTALTVGINTEAKQVKALQQQCSQHVDRVVEFTNLTERIRGLRTSDDWHTARLQRLVAMLDLRSNAGLPFLVNRIEAWINWLKESHRRPILFAPDSLYGEDTDFHLTRLANGLEENFDSHMIRYRVGQDSSGFSCVVPVFEIPTLDGVTCSSFTDDKGVYCKGKETPVQAVRAASLVRQLVEKETAPAMYVLCPDDTWRSFRGTLLKEKVGGDQLKRINDAQQRYHPVPINV